MWSPQTPSRAPQTFPVEFWYAQSKQQFTIQLVQNRFNVNSNNTDNEAFVASNVFSDADEADPDEEEEEVVIDGLEIEKELHQHMKNNQHAQTVATYHREKSALTGREVIIRGPGQHATT